MVVIKNLTSDLSLKRLIRRSGNKQNVYREPKDFDRMQIPAALTPLTRAGDEFLLPSWKESGNLAFTTILFTDSLIHFIHL